MIHVTIRPQLSQPTTSTASYTYVCSNNLFGEILSWYCQSYTIMCFGIVNHAKLCVFYRVLMCLKIVIEDQVEDTKFAQEKFKKNTYS